MYFQVRSQHAVVFTSHWKNCRYSWKIEKHTILLFLHWFVICYYLKIWHLASKLRGFVFQSDADSKKCIFFFWFKQFLVELESHFWLKWDCIQIFVEQMYHKRNNSTKWKPHPSILWHWKWVNAYWNRMNECMLQ